MSDEGINIKQQIKLISIIVVLLVASIFGVIKVKPLNGYI